jgi:hypothetical protein
MAADQIYYLQNNQIDKQRWDNCIEHSSNGLPYAYSFYLDAMADQWHGLVLNDYEAVMPLPFRKKFGIHYLYQPFLTAQLGLFGNNVGAALLEEFLDAIPQKFRLWEFSLNHQNLFPINGFDLYQRSNYVLGLGKTYEELSAAYRENSKRNIKKALSYGCSIQKDVKIEEIIALNKLQSAKPASEKDYQNFQQLFHRLKEKGNAVTYGVMQNNQLIASACFLFSHNRAYYILVGNHPNGRTLGASHLLIDAFIKDHAGKNLLLDFEGSDLRNLAFFYSGFGAKEEKYAAIRYNNLPWYVKLLKG